MKYVSTVFFLLVCLVIFSVSALGQSTVFYDNFNRAALSPGGAPAMTYNTPVNTSNTGVPIIESASATGTVPYFKLVTYLSAGTTAGQSYMTGPLASFSSQYKPTLSSNTGVVTWSFNIRENQGTMNGLLNTQRYIGVVLAASEADLLSATCQGYMISQGATTTSGLQLVKFSAGLGNAATPTTIIAAPTVTSSKDWFSVKVTYEPSTNTWTLYQRTDALSATVGWADPSVGTFTSVSTPTIDADYVGTTMSVFGFFGNHPASNTAFNCLFDNFRVQVNVPVTWTTGWPKVENATPTGFTAKAKTDVASTAYFVVLPSGAPAPTSAQVKAGQNAAGTAVAANEKGSIVCAEAMVEYSSAVTGLLGTTTYDVYFASEDAAGQNLQSTPAKVSATTTASATAPLINEPTVSGITNNSSVLGGNITSDGGSSLTERGTVWKISTGVTITDNKLAEGNTGTGVFTHSRSSLPTKTQIYYKAYASNAIGTTLSSEGNFFTLADEPINQVTNFSANSTSSTSIDLSWSAAAGADGYIILQKKGSAVAPTGTPVDANVYPVGSSLGNGFVSAYITSGSVTSKTITGLLPTSIYAFIIMAYNSDGVNYQTYNYLSTLAPTASDTTLTPLAPGILLGKTAINFGNVKISDKKTDTISITNNGTDTLRVSSINASNSIFNISDTIFNLPPSGVKSLVVSFTAKDTGTMAGKFIISHNAGTGKDTIQVTAFGVSVKISFEKTVMNFGSIAVGVQKKDSVVVTNTGTGTLTVDSVKSDNVIFTVTPANSVIAPAGTAKFYVTFGPTSIGAKTANILLYNNSPSVKDTVKVSGTGVQAAFALAPATISFGGSMTGQTKKDSVVVTNNGTAALVIDSVKSDNAMITVTSSTGTTIAPSTSFKFYINFTPTSAGLKSAKVVFYHKGPSKTDTLSASGTGVAGAFYTEDFTSAASTVLTSAGWTISGTSVVSPITITAPGLSIGKYSGSGVGNAATLTTTGQDVFAGFPSINAGTVYLSFMMNVTSAGTGDYFIALSPASSQTNYYARLHIKTSGTGYVLGISKSNEVTGGAQYGTTVLSFNNTALVVVKYTFTAADTTNDPISVYAFTSTIPITEPATAEIASYVVATKSDAIDLGNVTLRQGSTGAAPALVIDGLRVGTTWALGVPTAVNEMLSGIPTVYELHNNYPNPFNPSTTIQYGLPQQSNVTVKIYSILGQEVKTLVNDIQNPSYYRVVWNGTNSTGKTVGSGIYFVRITAQSSEPNSKPFIQVKKMLLMK